jgi:hypothetical protein
MGAVVEVISNAVSDVVEAAGDVVSDVGQAVESVGQTVGNIAENVAENPLPVLVSIAAQAVGIPAPLTAAAITAAQGGSIEDIAQSAAASYVGGQVAGQVSSALPTDVAQVVQDIVPSAAQGATAAAITGQDPLLAALGSGIAGGVAGQVTPELGQTTGTIAGQAAGTAATGGNVAQAVGSGLVSAGLGQVSGTLGDLFGGGQAPAPTDVAQAEQPEGQSMDEILAGMITEEMNQPSTPSPYAPLAAGGAVSDVSPTPLVPTGTVTTEFVSPPTPVDALGGGEGIALEDLPELPEDTGQAYTPPISQGAQQAFDVAQGYAGTTPPISAGPVTQPSTQAPTMGGGGISPQDQDLLDLINAVEGSQGTQPSAPSGTEVSGESMGVTETPAVAEEDTEFVDTGPKEPGEQLPAEGGVSTVTVMGPAATPVRTRRAGFAPSDSTLSALLGTSLSEGAAEPIMGEDEGKRRAVWNIESLRNALGI